MQTEPISKITNEKKDKALLLFILYFFFVFNIFYFVIRFYYRAFK